MFVEKVHTYGEGNIVSHEDCVGYYYWIKPINSLYASDTQLQTLIETLREKILSVNMPGCIYILPRRVNEREILHTYESLYKENGRKELDPLAKSVWKDIRKQLSDKVRYRYRICIVFTDNREPLKRRFYADLLKRQNDPLDGRTVSLCEVVDEQIYKKLASNLSVERLTMQDVEELHNYLALPVEGRIVEHYTTPQPTLLQQDYMYERQTQFRTIYTRTLIAERIDYVSVKGAGANTVVNKIQEYDYPVDTIVKFDLEHTQAFRRNMTSKREDIRKSAKRYYNLSDRQDMDAKKAMELAKIGENADPSIEDSKLRWQMLFRLRANDETMLNKRTDRMRKRFEGKHVPLTYAIGEQERLARQLFPYASCYPHYLNLTDVLYFASFNFFGGLYIGEEAGGTIATYTNPADLPILVDVEAPVKGKAKSASSTMIFAGETGAGKSQIANNFVMTSMIFYGHKTLNIDPKGDRMELIDTLNRYGDLASHLVIGDKDSPSGMFDAFLLHPEDPMEALALAKNDILNLSRAVNHQQKVNLMLIDQAYDQMCLAKKHGRIQRLTMSHLVDYLMSLDPEVAGNVKSLKNDPMARLFFGEEDTDVKAVFRLDRPYNLVTFAKLPVFSKQGGYVYHEDDLEHRIYALIIAKTTEITNRFIRMEKGKPKTLLIDEAKLWSSVPGGIDVLINNNLIARSEMMNLLIILQNWSDLPDSIINNTGQFFIGSMKSKQEIDHILKHFDLTNNSALAGLLMDRTKDEGLSEAKKYNFLYVDYNNRKCMTKLKFLDTFSKAFNTLKKERKQKPITINNGDDPL